MKCFDQTFLEWIQMFNNPENRNTFDHLRNRMSFCTPTANYNTLRFEIHHCLVFDLNQAAITLTNHYLEKFLKMSIIEMETNMKITNLKEYAKKSQKAVDNYGSNNLEQTINHAKSLGIVSKAESKFLKELKKMFRNPFSHSDINETFGNDAARVWRFSLKNPQIPLEEAVVPVTSFLPFHGTRQDEIAKLSSFAYFIYVDDLSCRHAIKCNPDFMRYQQNKNIDYIKVFDTYLNYLED